MTPTPSPRVLRLLGRLLPPRYRDETLGDLCEEAFRRATKTSKPSTMWFWLRFARSASASWYHYLRPPYRSDFTGRGKAPNSGDRAMSLLRQDLIYAFRTMRRRPLFTITAVLTLSLGHRRHDRHVYAGEWRDSSTASL